MRFAGNGSAPVPLLAAVDSRSTGRLGVRVAAGRAGGLRGRSAWRGRQCSHLSLQIFDLELRIALGGRHPGVTQQLLHRAEVGPGTQGVGGEGVAQYMWPGAISDAG